ncbi:hypothetical protein D3C75_1223900 [compost metagenome]
MGGPEFFDPGVAMGIVTDFPRCQFHVLQGTLEIHWLDHSGQEAINQGKMSGIAFRLFLEAPLAAL